MIITGAKALKLVSNHEILTAVPELLASIEAYAAANRRYQPKKNCPSCDRTSFFAPVEEMAINAIAGLSSEGVQRLKQYLKRNELFVNVSRPGKPGETRELK